MQIGRLFSIMWQPGKYDRRRKSWEWNVHWMLRLFMLYCTFFLLSSVQSLFVGKEENIVLWGVLTCFAFMLTESQGLAANIMPAARREFWGN